MERNPSGPLRSIRPQEVFEPQREILAEWIAPNNSFYFFSKRAR